MRLVYILLTFSLVSGISVAEDDFSDVTGGEPEEGIVAPSSAEAKEEYIAPVFQAPTIDKKATYFVDWFDDQKGIGKRWIKSTAKKEGIEEALSKYNGKWSIESPTNVVIEKDYGLIVKTKARHHAIAATLNKPFKFEGKPLVVQYEVKYEEGQECGGGYLKLLSANSGEKIDVFTDKTPYTVMFGPDKCGLTSAKAHFIVRLRNPKNGTISEHNAKQPSKSLAPFFDDKRTHLYTLIVKPDNAFQVLIDNAEIISGNMLTDLEPSIVPPKEIFDPEDKKPSDWDDREKIEDPEAKKPEDWDESQPKEIVDEDAVKPSDWLEEEESLIPDPSAKQPEDWDPEMDSEWEAKKIPNPKCEGISGCGKWTAPNKKNPLYKGKWTPSKISNPAYKGKWSPRLMENPHYFDADPYKQLAPIGAIGFELWTMCSGIVFDNIIIADDESLVREFARQTFNIKVDQEELFHRAANPSSGILAMIVAATEERPWLWGMFVLALLVPVILVAVFCFGRKSPSKSSHPKKTDAPQPDDEDEQEAETQEGDEPEDEDKQGLSQESDDENATGPSNDSKNPSLFSKQGRKTRSKANEESEQSADEQRQKAHQSPSTTKTAAAEEEPSPSVRKTRRARRED